MITQLNIRASISTTMILGGMMLCASANAQNSNLQPCPKVQGVVWSDCFGSMRFPDGKRFSGEFKGGKINGNGTLTLPNGSKYVGEFKDSKYHGLGTQSWPNGEKFVGEFSEDKRNGQGTHTFPDGSKFEGTFTKDIPNGYGILYNAKGNISQMGIWNDGKFVRQSNVNSASPPVIAPPPPVSPQKASSGTAFRITNGQFITNHHVVDGCNMLKVGDIQGGRVLASDPINDLALVSISNDSGEIARIRTTRTQLNEAVTVAGFPLRSLGLSGLTITNGTISSLSGLKGDTGQLQISAPTQPGNSGGPLLDSAGNVIGVVSGGLNSAKIAGDRGIIPQNVNFAIGGNTLRAFLDAKGVNYKEAGNERELTGVQIAARASGFTVLVECR